MDKYIYEVINEGTPQEIILRSDGACIPKNEANADYQAYLNKDKPQVEHLTEIIPPVTE